MRQNKKKKLTQKEKNIRKEILSEMLRLSTASFGLVAALAWNEVIRELINSYIKPLVGKDSGLISLGIYALVITIIAVLVTYNLGRIKEKIE